MASAAPVARGTRRISSMADLQICSACGEEKTASEFRIRKKIPLTVTSSCRACWTSWRKVRRSSFPESRPEVQRRYNLKRHWGFTPDDFARILEKQGGGCAVCGNPDPGGRGSFHVDHDHVTGEFRGLLCHGCNTGLGLFKDDSDRLMQAMMYLLRFQEKGNVTSNSGVEK